MITDPRELIDALQLTRRLLRNQQDCKHSLCTDCDYSRKQLLELLELILAREPVVVTTHADYLGGRKCDNWIINNMMATATCNSREARKAEAVKCDNCGMKIDPDADHRIPAAESTSGKEVWLCEGCAFD